MELKSLLLGATAGAIGYYFWDKDKKDKSKSNPEHEIERQLEDRIREMDMKERIFNSRLPPSDRY